MEIDLKDRFQWGCYFMQDDLTARCSVMHERIARLPGEKPKVIVIGFRLGAKTTWGSKLTALYEATEEPTDFIRISSNTSLLAEDILRQVKEHLKENRFLLEHYPWLTKKWERDGTDEIILPNGVKIQARGFMHIKRGPHPGREIIDDPHDKIEIKSEVIRANFIVQFLTVAGSWKPAMPGQAETRVLYTANFLHPLDPSVQLYNNSFALSTGIDVSDWERVKFESGYHDRRPVWPEVWPMEKLEAKRRAMGWQAFDAEFENRPEFFLEPVIKPEWFRKYKADDMTREDLQNASLFINYDAAFSLKESADYWVAGLWAKFHEGRLAGKVRLLKHVNNRALLDDNVRGMLGWCLEHNSRPAIVHFKREGKDRLIVKQAVERLLRQERMNIIQVDIDKEDFPGDKRQRLMAVSGMFQQGEVELPEEDSEIIINQILMLGEGDFDDYVDLVSDGSYYSKKLIPARNRAKTTPAYEFLTAKSDMHRPRSQSGSRFIFSTGRR